ncbi:MAG: hypothetical protein HFJ75_00560 [Eggerthellaceae bacterium]|nr:hypothetical protein [Eggerthellaceae bacterium]
MAKKISVSHANKMIRELRSEADFNQERSRRSLRLGLATLAGFVLLIIVEQTLVRLGAFGDAAQLADNITLAVLMLDAFVSVHFWMGYARGNRRYKECLRYIDAYREQGGTAA